MFINSKFYVQFNHNLRMFLSDSHNHNIYLFFFLSFLLYHNLVFVAFACERSIEKMYTAIKFMLMYTNWYVNQQEKDTLKRFLY